MEAIIFTGLQASGKSSFYKERFFNTHVRVSLDLLKTRNRERRMMQLCLETQAKLVVDNTNPSIDERRPYIKAFREEAYRVVGYYFSSSIKECLERNKLRVADDFIPERGILATYSKLQIPSMSEGFDELYYVKLGENGFAVSEWEDEV